MTSGTAELPEPEDRSSLTDEESEVFESLVKPLRDTTNTPLITPTGVLIDRRGSVAVNLHYVVAVWGNENDFAYLTLEDGTSLATTLDAEATVAAYAAWQALEYKALTNRD